VAVHPANIQDRDGVELVLVKIFADAGY